MGAGQPLIKLGGGFVVGQGKKVLAEVPLAIAGITSEQPCEEVVRRREQVDKACWALGSSISKPFLLLQTLAFTGLPYLRLTDKGLLDIREKKFVPLLLNS